MSVKRIVRAAALGLTCLNLVACGNAPGREVTGVSVAKGIFSRIANRGAAPATPDPAQVAQQVANTLAATTGQVIVVSIPNRDALAVMQEIERNGAYTTYGTSDRRSLTLKGGMLTATRGLGNDLMSADVDGPARLIRARQEGRAERVNRHLDGENLTLAPQMICIVTPGGQSHITIGTIDSPVTQVEETCTSLDETRTNTYRVSPDGRILQSRQWVSPLNGYIVIQQLR